MVHKDFTWFGEVVGLRLTPNNNHINMKYVNNVRLLQTTVINYYFEVFVFSFSATLYFPSIVIF